MKIKSKGEISEKMLSCLLFSPLSKDCVQKKYSFFVVIFFSFFLIRTANLSVYWQTSVKNPISFLISDTMQEVITI